MRHRRTPDGGIFIRSRVAIRRKAAPPREDRGSLARVGETRPVGGRRRGVEHWAPLGACCVSLAGRRVSQGIRRVSRGASWMSLRVAWMPQARPREAQVSTSVSLGEPSGAFVRATDTQLEASVSIGVTCEGATNGERHASRSSRRNRSEERHASRSHRHRTTDERHASRGERHARRAERHASQT